jgi:hypothetical protein
MIRRFATDSRLRMALSLLAIAISVVVGLATASVSWAGMVLGGFALMLSLSRLHQERSESSSS